MVPVAPARVLDTRATKPVGAESSLTFQLAGTGSIPAGVSAVVLNLTVTTPQSFGHITAYPSGTARPDSSNLNFAAGQTVPNLVTVPVGADGKVTLYNRSSGTTQLIADVFGYYLPGTPAVPGAFAPVSPARVLDTRATRAVGAESSLSFQVAGIRGVPASVSAVVLNVTVTTPQSFGHIIAYPSGKARPDTSNLNFAAGQTVPNSVTVPVGADGKVTLYNRSSGTTQLIADVFGYYLPGTPTVPGAFGPLTPARMLDTRTTRAVDAESPLTFQVAGTGSIPAGVSAVVLNVTVTTPQSLGHIIAYPSGTARPDTSNLNFAAGQTVPNLVTVPVGTDGRVTLYNRSSGTTQLIADVFGYYLPGSPAGSVWTWGSYYDEPGGPQQVPGISGATAVTGTSTKYALLPDGTVRAWGNNAVGQFGNGTTTGGGTTYSSSPVEVTGLTSVKSVVAGYGSAYAVLTDGTVRAWGGNYYGDLGNGTTVSSSTPVQVTGLTGVQSVTTSGFTAYALLTDGSVRAWGYNGRGGLGAGTTTDSNVPVTVTGLTGVKSIVTTMFSAYAVLADGTVRAWGSGVLGNGTTTDSNVPVTVTGLRGVKSMVSAYGGTAYALLTDGTVRAWGSNFRGELGDGTTTSSSTIPVQVTGLTGVESVVAGYGSAYALLIDGTIRAWGANTYGQLGNGTTANSSVPVQVTGLTAVKSLASSSNVAYALLADGTVWVWGFNTMSSTPAKVTGLSAITSLLL